jgi:hypothetical protein
MGMRSRFGEWNELKVGEMNKGRNRDPVEMGSNEQIMKEKRV